MTVEQWQQPADTAPVPVSVAPGVVRLIDAAQEADAAYQLAQRLTTTAFCPVVWRGRPADAAAAMLAGAEVGLSPLAALRAFDVIEGVAAPRAATLRAVVQARGHHVELVESTATRCRMRGRRAGAVAWQDVQWTIDRAKQLGLTGKKNWTGQPQAMLVARATSEVCRLIASDAILGLGGGYAVEELIDGDGVVTMPAPAPVAPPRARRTLAYRPAAPAPAGQQPVDDAALVVPVEDAPPAADEVLVDTPPPPRRKPATPAAPAQDDTLTLAQRGKINGRLGALGVTGDERLEVASVVLGRIVTSTSAMTRHEASQLIDQLEAFATGSDLRAWLNGDDMTVTVEAGEPRE